MREILAVRNVASFARSCPSERSETDVSKRWSILLSFRDNRARRIRAPRRVSIAGVTGLPMTTPMSVYSRIAERFGVDSTDEDSVDEFFLKAVPAMEADTRGAILQELMRNLGGSRGKGGSAGEPLEEIPLIPLDNGGAPRRAKQPRSIDDQLNGIINQLVGNGITLEQAVEAFEGKYIVAAMSASRGNVRQASSALGVHRSTLHNKLRSQTMLNGFAESMRPARRRMSANRVRSPKSGAGSRTAGAMQKRRPSKSRLNKK